MVLDGLIRERDHRVFFKKEKKYITVFIINIFIIVICYYYYFLSYTGRDFPLVHFKTQIRLKIVQFAINIQKIFYFIFFIIKALASPMRIVLDDDHSLSFS